MRIVKLSIAMLLFCSFSLMHLDMNTFEANEMTITTIDQENSQAVIRSSTQLLHNTISLQHNATSPRKGIFYIAPTYIKPPIKQQNDGVFYDATKYILPAMYQSNYLSI
ncbi:hypothetical protein ACWE42_12300 [Sutcliffiella cohnii]|uniref:hypothetical protein n=1 Tax=Sutcliffiella TaxID=2837511 RepID=UPI0022DD4BF9|nr:MULTISPECIES: hypothetical protein [Sutcliffiella]MED4018022.1 hypothetical protein [Sutcliffiella cohnii]WBL16482.1 hypothetical protein O1A01_07575 [Sutcliffiella sp. NC1]